MTNEQPYVHQALHEHNVAIRTQVLLDEFDGCSATLSNIFTGKAEMVEVRSVVIVGLRLPSDGLYHQLEARSDDVAAAGIKSVERIGDVLAAGALVHAVYSGHAYAQQLDGDSKELYLRDIPVAEYPPGQVI